MQMLSSEVSQVKCCEWMEARFSAAFFKALSDPNRLKALFAFARFGRPCTVSEVAACCPTEFSVTSKHLAQLKKAGILTSEKIGREVVYSVKGAEVAALLRACADAIENCCPREKTDEGVNHGNVKQRKEKRDAPGNPPAGVPGIY